MNRQRLKYLRMKKDPEIIDDELDYEDIDISNLISPRCDFHVSPGFKQKLMEEVKAMPRHHPRLRWLPPATVAAAAVAALVVFSLFHFRDLVAPVENPSFIATRDIPISDNSLKRDETVLTVTESSLPKQKKRSFRKSKPTKRLSSDTVLISQSVYNENSKEIRPQPVTEGEMPLISEERLRDPDEMRVRLIARHRNAEIAYIESIRDEIAANHAYIKQLISETDVSQ